MVLRIIVAVAVGTGIGLAVGMAGRALGGGCPLLCNPYVSTGICVVLALYVASGGEPREPLVQSDSILKVDTGEMYEQVRQAPGRVVLLVFYTSSCPSCRKQMQAVNALADRWAGRVTVGAVDAGELKSAAGTEDIRTVPTIVVYRDGERVEALTGLTAAADVEKEVRRQLASLGEQPPEQEG